MSVIDEQERFFSRNALFGIQSIKSKEQPHCIKERPIPYVHLSHQHRQIFESPNQALRTYLLNTRLSRKPK